MSFLKNPRGFVPIIIVLVVVALSASLLILKKITTKTDSGVKILAQVVSQSPPPSPTATPTLAPTIKPTPKPTPVPTTPPPVLINNAPPGAGYSNQTVNVDGVNYPVKIVAADLNSTKVIVDTASESNCANNCPVLSLADYASRNGAFAGINGSYFCPADYASCAGKTNSFDTIIMNKNKVYFNSDNNVYSTVPAAIFSAGSARFVGQSLEWGRDTSVDAVIANYPLLVAGGNINFTEAPNEPKFGGKAARTFIATKGNMVYIGIVYNASMGESAKVLKAMAMDQAMNLDQGGSTALWSGGYVAGPGRNIPNAVLFIRR
ncbi:phosphodiester glycosidase family protein [Candidatus Daviesbacteria bacterium]|nr:phosphodiester glycosidase family protein [Candidatus Daviesbacteria bacterium]